MALNIGFWILAVVCIVAALMVVSLRNVFRAALALVMCFLAIAGLYFILRAEFLGVIQILVYVGAVSVVIILAIMMTREYQRGSPDNRFRVPAFIIAALFLGVVLFAMVNTSWNVAGEVPATDTAALAHKLFGEDGYILPILISGTLLLAAVVGAVVLVRDK
jgi:NADH-quinone oxidoreductase subunit J